MSGIDDIITALREHNREAMPPEVCQAVDTIIGNLVVDLGESPEAWWGCYATLEHIVMRSIITAIETDEDVDGPVLTMIRILCEQFLSHPMAVASIKVAFKERRKASEDK